MALRTLGIRHVCGLIVARLLYDSNEDFSSSLTSIYTQRNAGQAEPSVVWTSSVVICDEVTSSILVLSSTPHSAARYPVNSSADTAFVNSNNEHNSNKKCLMYIVNSPAKGRFCNPVDQISVPLVYFSIPLEFFSIPLVYFSNPMVFHLRSIGLFFYSTGFLFAFHWFIKTFQRKFEEKYRKDANVLATIFAFMLQNIDFWLI